MWEFGSVHHAVEMGDLESLRDLLDAGADIHEEQDGLTPLHLAVDVETDGHTQTGTPLRADVTAYLLARGADPVRRPHGGTGVSAEHQAFVSGHWIATALFEVWKRDRGQGSRS